MAMPDLQKTSTWAVKGPFSRTPVEIQDHPPREAHPPLLTHPLAPLLIPNNASDARDHLANERTFLSWLRLGVFMAVVSVAIILSFHLKQQPTPLERRVALPLGLIFWLLSLSCVGLGTVNYVRCIRGYAKRRALVQTGMGTQVVFTIVATVIVGSCILFLSTNTQSR